MPAPAPSLESGERVAFDISLDGKPFDTLQLVSIETWSEANRIPRARIVLTDGEPSDGEFRLSDCELLKPGVHVALSAGYGSGLSQVHSGVIARHSIRVLPGSGAQLVVETADPLLSMTRSRHSRVTSGETDTDVLSALVSAAGGSIERNDAGSAPVEAIVQHQASDWDMLLIRAEANGCVVLVEGGKVSIVFPTPKGEPVLTARYGDSIVSFEGTIDASLEYGEQGVKSRSWSYTGQNVSEAGPEGSREITVPGNLAPAELADVFGGAPLVQQTSAFLDESRLGAWSAARLMRAQLACAQGTASFQGSSAVKPGLAIALAGLGGRFNGNAFVSGVRHRIAEGQWITTVQFGMSPESFASSRIDAAPPAAAGLAPPVRGLMAGQVRQVATDPAGELRVQVALPLIDAENAIWARLGQFHASSGFGAVFYPEVGDEVIVGFMNEDPAAPVVLGSLYSSGRSPAEGSAPTETNDIKAIVTRSKLELQFDDKQTVLTIKTPGGRSVVLDDSNNRIEIRDGDGNSVSLADDGVKIVSGAALTLQSATDMTVKCGGTLSVSAAAQYSLSAPQIGISADASCSVQSNGLASLQAAAELTVSGALVRIN